VFTKETIKLNINILSGQELADYRPEEKFWPLRLFRLGHDVSNIDFTNSEPVQDIRLFVLRIEFSNQSSVDIEIPFSNITCKAELLGLIITDKDSSRVQPSCDLCIRPAPQEKRLPLLSPGNTWIYDLVGEIDGGNLIFPGATYALDPEQEYSVQFSYMTLLSNTVRFRID
jgi:hypothetical protein